ncbi:hypothetical protein NW768_010917 [Fusarium equiseti]|uniref:Calcineurin-like phosphoesterase domain-containing protein n=1 Tax=Fusarium equiseti TaxID=61235 RepID=A0ABQ8QZB6_FUSEQ|nr:hypothetical protein NW768_010917 [Fusarium equiseti]
MTTQDTLQEQLSGLQIAASTSWHRLQTHVQDVKLTGRLIIVGDVHGHLPELKSLLEKVSYDKNNGDQLIFVGDLINKGPDSPGVVQMAMDHEALAIRGNNEDRVLAAYSAAKRGEDAEIIERWNRFNAEAEKEGDQPVRDDLTALSREDLKPYMAASDFGTAASLSDEQIKWLASQPLILRIKLPREAATAPWDAGTLIIAHGGLVPQVPLEQQDPWAVMNMRGLAYPDPDAETPEAIKADMIKGAKSRVRRYAAFQHASDEEIKTQLTKMADVVKNGEGFTGQHKDGLIGFPLESREGDWWIDAWNRWQHTIENAEERSIVVYGHDARVGLQVGDPAVARYTFGLDSGCVYGRSLTALVIDRKDDGLKHEIVQVDAVKKAEEKAEGSA